MSSLINDVSSSSAGMPEDPNSNDRIIHFDATQRRKDKMRQMSSSDKSSAAPVQAVATPTPTTPAAPAPAAAPHSGSSNGHVAPVAAAPPVPVAASAPAAVAPTPAPAAVAPAPAAEATTSTSGSMSGKELESFLINFVVEQTGYPEEMVELDVDLEADLGIDSIKKAQLFGELSEFFEVTVTEDLSLDNFPTLQHVADFLATVPQKGAAPVASTPAPASVTPTPAPAAVAPTPAPVAEAPAASSGSMSGKELESFLINFVVEQTGYPEEMVELDVDLEADLGIDSIKKAQLFGELSEFFEVTVTEDLSLDNFPTLQHVADFLATVPQKGTAAAAAPSPAPAVAPAPAPAAVAPTPAPVAEAPAASTGGAMSTQELESFLINFVVEQTGYPEEMVELDVDLEADLGIDSIKKAQLFGELSEFFEVTVTEDLSLDNFPTLQHVADFLATVPQKGAAPVASTPAPAPVTPTPAPAAVAPTPAPVAEAPAASGNGMSDDQLESFLINFVVEQTGYPEEMVELDVDLEADLGIDSIKKAQLFGELSEFFEVTVSEDLSLDNFPTLRHVKDFLKDKPRR